MTNPLYVIEDRSDTDWRCTCCQKLVKKGSVVYSNDEFDTCSIDCLTELIDMPIEKYPRGATYEW